MSEAIQDVKPAPFPHKPTPTINFTSEEKELIKKMVNDRLEKKDWLTEEEFELFFYTCKARGLNPILKQIYAMKKDGRLIFHTSIDGFRIIAERTGKYCGQVGPFWCGEDGVWKDVWIEKGYPKAAKVGILRSDFKEPVWGVARFDSYNNSGSFAWKRLYDLMISKCSEALGLRKTFPEDLSGLYTDDEISSPEPTPKAANPANSANPANPEPKKEVVPVVKENLVEDFFKLNEEYSKVFGEDGYKKYFVNSKKESPALERIKLFESPKQLAWLRTGTNSMREDLKKHAENPVPASAETVMAAITETEKAEKKEPNLMKDLKEKVAKENDEFLKTGSEVQLPE